MKCITAEEREAIRKDVMTRERKSNQRIEEATQRIVEISAELHLTVYEFEKVFEKVKHRAVMGAASPEESW